METMPSAGRASSADAQGHRNLPPAPWVQAAGRAAVKSMLPRAGDNGDSLQKSAKEGLASSGRVSGGLRVDSFSARHRFLDGGQGGGREQKILPEGRAHGGQGPGYCLEKPSHRRRLMTGPDLSSKMRLPFLPPARFSRSTVSYANGGSPYDLSRFAASDSSPRRTMCFPCHLLQRENHVSMFSVLPTAKIILRKAFFLDE